MSVGAMDVQAGRDPRLSRKVLHVELLSVLDNAWLIASVVYGNGDVLTHIQVPLDLIFIAVFFPHGYLLRYFANCMI
jgi:hypothetical protein